VAESATFVFELSGELKWMGQRRRLMAGFAMGLSVVWGWAFSASLTAHAAANATTTTVNITASANPSGYGELVIFNVTVSAVTGTPAGTVTFLDGTSPIGSATLDSNGSAAFSETTLTSGLHQITAQYGGDSTFAPSTSPTVDESVTVQGSTTMAFTTLSQATYGRTITFVVTVLANAGAQTPAGNVTLTAGSTVLGTSALDSSGQAVFENNTLPVGKYSVTASYAGDGNFASSLSTSLTQTVTPASTTLALSSSANPSTFNAPVTLTATVTPVSGSGPTGSVDFLDGATDLGSVPLSGDKASLKTAALGVGSHSLTAKYSGDSNFAGSSAALTQTVNTAATTAAVGSSANPSVFGSAVTLSATVTSSAGTPTGSITFFDGTTSLGSVTLNSSGAASLTTSALSVGSHSVTVQYSGDSNFSPSTSPPLVQSVGTEPTATTLQASANPITYGQSVTLTASVSAGVGTPSGTVSFSDGPTPLGSASLVNGVAAINVPALQAGDHSVLASYAGDANDSASASDSFALTVNKAGSATTVLSSSNPAIYGSVVSFTATVTSGAAKPTGTVTFSDGTTVLASVALNASGVATLATGSLGIGSHNITAAFSGDSHLSPSSDSLSQVVVVVPTTTTVASTQNPSTYGVADTVTATVTALDASAVSGSVTFTDGSTVLATVPLSGGKASFDASTLAVGAHTITASYSGAATDAASTSSPLDEVVTAIPTAVTLTSSANPSTLNQAVTFTATVSESGGTPSGTVTFSDGGSTLAQVALVNGVASYTTSSLTLGTHPITASYGGSATESASTSSVLSQQVALAQSHTLLSSSLNPSKVGQAVDLTATESSAAGTPSGSITFYDGSTSLGTLSLSGGVATLTVSSLAAGTHLLSATYAGSTTITGSTSNQLAQDVAGGDTSSTLTASANPVKAGTPLTFTATVTSGYGTPAGTVDFYDGTTLLGSQSVNNAGVAALPVSGLSSGTHAITALYMGGGDFNPSKSATVDEVVTNNGHVHPTVKDCVQDLKSGKPRWVERVYCYVENFGSSSVPDRLADRYERWIARHHDAKTSKHHGDPDR
jgi:hypothetical protein